jgi:HK97 family phage major capsid protein
MPSSPEADTEIKSLIEGVQRDVKGFKDTHAELLKAKADGKAVSDLESKIAALNLAIDTKQDEIKARVDRIETALRRTKTDPEGKGQTEEQIAHKKALDTYLRKGRNEKDLQELEAKAMSVGSDPDGGFHVSPDTTGRVVTKVYETSPFRQYASAQTIGTDRLKGEYDLDEASAGWVSERGSRSETNTPQMGWWEIPVHELYANPKATQQLLDDANVNIEQWLADKVSSKFGRIENDAFVNGDGAGKPRGILTYASGTTFTNTVKQIEQINSGSNGALTADGILSLMGALKTAYQNGAIFGFTRAGITAIRKLKDSQNRYLWEPSYQAGKPSLLLGYPCIEFPDLQAIANDSLSGFFANLAVGYQIVDRQGIRTLRDPYTDKPNVSFYTTKRVGGDVVNHEAIKIQKLAA